MVLAVDLVQIGIKYVPASVKHLSHSSSDSRRPRAIAAAYKSERTSGKATGNGRASRNGKATGGGKSTGGGRASEEGNGSEKNDRKTFKTRVPRW